MKQLFIAALALSVVACGSKNETTQAASSNTDNESAQTKQGEEPAENTHAGKLEGGAIVCLWKELSVRDGAGSSAKWVTTVYLGEKMNHTGNSETLSEKGKDVTYHEVVLIDDTKGWVRSDFVALNAKRGVLKNNTKVYKRPDILTGTDKELAEMDFVAVLDEKDDWVEVKFKRPSDSWFVTGYIKKDHVSYNEGDVAISLLYHKAMLNKDRDAQMEAIEQILENPDLQQAGFHKKLKNRMEEAKGYTLYANSGIEAEVGIVPMATYEKNRNWKAHWTSLKEKGHTQVTPAILEGLASGDYALIFSTMNDSNRVGAVKFVTLDKISNNSEVSVESYEYQ